MLANCIGFSLNFSEQGYSYKLDNLYGPYRLNNYFEYKQTEN